ncbi:MAG: hypothetical protein Q8L79_03295 [Methylobacter sp.]|uniref:hypothetical protein n=1 Tax=Methylobacter sp. TaxID=2051955 RepID=UPI0027304CAD|nr:hypothetical protein [Methylobacter sp.]MDP1664127.1 hypothetical protein [Methylobacter sp.]
MTDYPELYQRLAQEILKRDGQITADTGAFIKQFLTQLQAEGRRLSGDAETALNSHLSGINTVIKEAIGSAVAVAAGLPLTPASLHSETVLKLAEQAFVESWPDGLTLSDRLWRWQRDTRTGVQQQLQTGIRQGKATGAVMYDMQRAIERGGNRFKIVTDHADDWVTELHQSAMALIHDPEARAAWKVVVGEAEERIALLKATGSRSAAEQVLKQIKAAVDKGSEELVDKAVKWWLYDKQLYNLKRIARTEMATAAHRAVIASVEGDESIIGFQWRLSSSHPTADICDYYANIEMGLGKGVWTKEAVPHHKAHPHCMCLLIPRVTPIKQAGSKNYAEFINNAAPERRDQLLPNWVKNLNKLGMPLDKFVNGNGLMTRVALKAQLGEDKFNVVNALAHAASNKDYGTKNLTRHKSKTAKFLDSLEPLRDQPEVDRFVRQVLDDPLHVDSRMQHYIQRRYVERLWDQPLPAFDKLFAKTVSDPGANIHRKDGNRYQIRSTATGWIAIIEPNGQRVSLFPDNADDLGESLWTLRSLLE